jgi:hypothetical protein
MVTRKNSLPRTGLGNEKPPSMNKPPLPSHLINYALDVVSDSSEHSEISKELVSSEHSQISKLLVSKWDTHWKSQITIPPYVEALRSTFFVATCRSFEQGFE